jgi:dihydroneopterin aldolase
MKDIIYIKDLRVKTIIGIFDWERKVKQEVSIDLEFHLTVKRQLRQIQLKIQSIIKLLQKA